MRLLHGTTNEHVLTIREEGLRVPVYLTDSEELAGGHACDRAEDARCLAVVCEVEVPELTYLESDPAMYLDPYPSVMAAHGCGYGDKRCWGRVLKKLMRRPIFPGDWERSLRDVHSVRYDGSIPPQFIGKCRVLGAAFEGDEV